MKAAVLKNWKEMKIEEVETPDIGPDEALIKVVYTGICGSDIHSFTGKHPLAHSGMILGHEFSGVIERSGSACKGFEAGDKVCAHIIQSCGKCDACRQGAWNLCRDLKVLGTQADGTFAEFVKVKADKLIKLPKDADLEVCALAEPFAVGVYATERLNVGNGDSVLIIGAGPIGICCAFAAQKAGASKVIISEVVDKRIEFARSLGFEVIDNRECDLEEEADRLTEGLGFQRIYETSGVPFSTELVTKVGAIHGTVMMVAYSKDPRPIDTWNLMRKEIVISSLRVHTQPAYEKAVRMLLTDKELAERLSKIITKTFNFADIQKAFFSSMDGIENCKIMVKITDE